MTHKILVIDDDTAILDAVTELLSQAGYRVFSASSAQAGVALARTEIPHLILMDLLMPGMSGVDAVRAVKADPSTRKIPVVALTAATSPGAAQLSAAGCVGYIPKPFDPATFRKQIASFLSATVSWSRHRWE